MKTPPYKLFINLAFLVTIYVYSVFLGARIFDDPEWGSSLIRAVPFAIVFGIVWIYYQNFPVLKRTMLCMMIIAMGIGIFYVLAAKPLGTHVYRQILYKSYKLDEPFTRNLYWYYATIALINIFLISPWLIFYINYVIGKRSACPKCHPVNGLFARKILGKEFCYTYSGVASVFSHQTTRRYREFYQPNVVVTETTNHYRDQKYQEDIYNMFCECRVCGHKWTFQKAFNRRNI